MMFTELNPVKILLRLSEKYAPGQSPDFNSSHVLLALLTVREESIGRKQLSSQLNLGEGTVRNIISRMQEEKLIQTSRRGIKLTEKGETLLDEISSFISGTPIDETKLTVSEHNYAVIVREKAREISLGIEQRDQALLSGAKGATTIIFKEGNYVIPGVDSKLNDDIKETLRCLNPKEDDVIIIGTGKTQFLAKIGAYSAAIDLIS